MLEELQTYWQEFTPTPEMYQAAQIGGVIVGALLLGRIVAGMVTRRLRAHNFDLALRLPGPAPVAGTVQHGFTPTVIAGLLVRLTIWAAAAWWLSNKLGRADVANTLSLMVSRAWAVAAMLVTVLALGSLLAHRL